MVYFIVMLLILGVFGISIEFYVAQCAQKIVKCFFLLHINCTWSTYTYILFFPTLLYLAMVFRVTILYMVTLRRVSLKFVVLPYVLYAFTWRRSRDDARATRSKSFRERLSLRPVGFSRRLHWITRANWISPRIIRSNQLGNSFLRSKCSRFFGDNVEHCPISSFRPKFWKRVEERHYTFVFNSMANRTWSNYLLMI